MSSTNQILSDRHKAIKWACWSYAHIILKWIDAHCSGPVAQV